MEDYKLILTGNEINEYKKFQNDVDQFMKENLHKTLKEMFEERKWDIYKTAIVIGIVVSLLLSVTILILAPC